MPEPKPYVWSEDNCLDPSWFGRKLTLRTAVAKHLVRDERLGWRPVPFGFANAVWLELLAQMQPGDELREYDTPAEDWQRNMGSRGVVLVRKGRAVDIVVTRMN